MTTILCYGDSITWGTNPEAGGARHAYADRWPSVLQAELGAGVQVIPEGLGGRTTIYDDWGSDCDRNGARLLPTIMHSHRPLALVLLMLGTNDLKPYIAGSAIAAAQGMRRLIEIVRHQAHRLPGGAPTPQVLVMAPPRLVPTSDPITGEMLGSVIAESHKFAAFYEREAKLAGCGFFDAATVAEASPIDGVHLDAANTRAIGAGVAPVVKAMLGLGR